MISRIRLVLVLIIIAGLYSCKTSQPVVSKSVGGRIAEDYVEKYKNLAVMEMKRTGVPASITLAQGMIESDFGRSRLAREANNHFGIKCHSDWTGPTIIHHDDRRNECFRKYRKPEESFYDHSDFLKNGSRYRLLFDLAPTDYKGWARGLKKAGYATNPEYANMLIRKIEENNLFYFDRENKLSRPSELKTLAVQETTIPGRNGETVNTEPSTAGSTMVYSKVGRIMENNRIQYVIVKDGDTRQKLEEEFQLLKWELAKYNELKEDFLPVPGQILYLQPKRSKAEPGKEFYYPIEGDTMYMISQKFGIKLMSLYEMNRMTEGTEPGVGEKIWLRSIRPAY